MLIIIIAIGLTFLSLLLTIFWLLKVSGLFTPIKINIIQPSFEFLTIVYKFQQGDYSTAADIFKDILNYSPSHSTIGIYYDNPDVVSLIIIFNNKRYLFLVFEIRHQLNNDVLLLVLLLMKQKIKK